MINLIKNELIKLAHKPGIYVLLFLFLLFNMIGAYDASLYQNDGVTSVGVVQEEYYNDLKKNIDTYDLSDSIELHWYVSDKNEIDFFEVVKDLDPKGPEYYFADNEIMPLIQCMNNSKYLDKNEVNYNECKREFDSFIVELRSFDWKKDIKERKDEIVKELSSLEYEHFAGSLNETDYSKQCELLNFENDLLDYRLKNKIPFANSYESYSLEAYYEKYILYSSMNPDEKSYKKIGELVEFRETKQSYFVDKHLFEKGKLTIEDSDLIYLSISSTLSFSGAIFLVLGLLIIFGGLISDEISKGTIKQLLIKPHTRSKILTSKIIAGLIAFLIFVLVFCFIYCLSYRLFCGGIESLFESVAIYDFSVDKVIEVNALVDILLRFISLLPMFLIILLFVLLVNIITSNSVASIGAGFILYFGSLFLVENGSLSENVVVNALLPFVNWDFTTYLYGGMHWFPYCNLGLSIVVSIVTIILLVVSAYLIFNYKDIKNQ